MHAQVLGDYQYDRRRRRRALLILAMAALSLSSLGATVASLALFTDTAVVSDNEFTTGGVDLTASPASAVLSVDPMMPGDSVTGSLTVTNTGSAQLRYAMTSSSTNADGKNLSAAIALEIRGQGTSCATFDGAQLYSGTLGAAAMGSPATGLQAGDRTLNAGAGEVLCLRASLPIGTDDSYESATTTATFTFQAEQTANNP